VEERVKIVIVGGFGVGKTTFVKAASETASLFTEAVMTEASAGVDDLSAIKTKTTTTVAMDWGRTTLVSQNGDRISLYLFGVPGQERFRFTWDWLVHGALGGVVLLDTRRPEDCFNAVEHLERHELPFVVAINHFPGSPRYPEPEIRESLQLSPSVPVIPVVECDARERVSSTDVLVELVQYLLKLSE
jgi:signal recognition particle receptor subunit beta